MGTTAIARCSPSNPTADTTSFLKETIEEGIPHAFLSTLKTLAGRSNRQRRKAIGDAYLNSEFGWKPFVSDLMNISQAVLNMNAIMSQYERDSGKLVRRSYFFPDVVEEKAIDFSVNCSPWISPSSSFLYDPSLVNKGKVIRVEKTTYKRWFKGAFTYYVPSDYRFTTTDGAAYAVIQARKTAGLSLSPDAVWNSMPWSWAVDWFVNVGDVLSNLSDWIIDNQVLQYGYIMEHAVREWTYTFVGETGFRARNVIVPSIVLRSESKVRRGATPYGFGLSFNGFSNRQKAIIAALGLTKGK
jgi:hypothetical protein